MNWNFLAGDFVLRLPVAENDQPLLFELLQQSAAVAHIPRTALIMQPQIEDEFRRMAQRFEAREAAFWLIENLEDKLIARVSVQHINWLQRSAQLVWELTEEVTLADMQQFMPKLTEFLFTELGLHRLEMRLRPDFQRHNDLLEGLGFEYEGCLPAQLEHQDENIDLAVWSLLSK